jgi:site-specific DNA recombinase
MYIVGVSLPVREQTVRRDLQPGDEVDIYLRLSRDPGHDELAVRRQERECRELCQRRGWRVAIVHRDDDRSAISGKRREGYEAALRRIELRRVRGLVAWHPDRLHRSPKELERFIDVVEASGAGIATVQGGEYDLGTASGRMSARIVGAVARHESEHKSERIRSKMGQLKRDGKLTGGGRRPYGYEVVKTTEGKLDRVIVRDNEAAIIRELTRRAIGGESLLSLVRDLKKRGIPAAAGGPWSLASMSRLLRSMRIAGLRDLDGKETPAPWPAIITSRDHHQLRTMLARNSRAGTRSQRSYLLTGGLIRCGGPHLVRGKRVVDERHPDGICGAAMIGRPMNGQPTYCCITDRGGCNKVFVRAANVDEIVQKTVVAIVDRPGLAKRLQRSGGKDADRVLDGISRQEERLREIEADYANGELERAEYRRLRDQANARLEDLRKDFKPTPTIDYGPQSPLGLAWPSLSLGQRRAVLDTLLVEVRIAPVGRQAGSKFDGDRVKLRWKV